jgi:hypothetical protein
MISSNYRNLNSKSNNSFYLLDKYFYDDNSINDNLFFIPSLHPLIQLNSYGEFWHPRSKIFNHSKIKSIKSFGPMFYDNSNIFPNFLSSKLEKNSMKEKFNKMKKNNRKILNKKKNNNLILYKMSLNNNINSYKNSNN